MGLPRSGTTLIENIILSSNDKIDNEVKLVSLVSFFQKTLLEIMKEDLFVIFDFKKITLIV